MEKIYSVKETAELLGCSVPQIYNMIKDGLLPASKPSGRIYFIQKSDIQKFLDRGKENVRKA